MRKRTLLILATVLALAVLLWPKTATQQVPTGATPPDVQPVSATRATAPGAARGDALPGFLPREARETVAAIQRGGPFPHRQDGSVFGNRERLLPARTRGYYREYTVETPGVDHRGARRIITGGSPPETWYYTADHYDSFRAFAVHGPESRR